MDEPNDHCVSLRGMLLATFAAATFFGLLRVAPLFGVALYGSVLLVGSAFVRQPWLRLFAIVVGCILAIAALNVQQAPG